MEHGEAEARPAQPARHGRRRRGPQGERDAGRLDLPVAVVTGGSSGIGAALVALLRERGSHVVGLSRSPSAADEHERCDVSDREAVFAAAARVLARHPSIDLLVVNAGVGARTPYLGGNVEAIERVVEVDYLGAVWTVLGFLPGLQPGAHVVNVVSVAGTVAVGPYSAAKHAQLAFSRSLAVELWPRGVKVHTVNPGFVETPGFPQRGVRHGRIASRFVVDPPFVAQRILDAVDHDRREVFVPRWYRPAAWLQALAPGLLVTARARTTRRPPHTH
jgi:NAD(P)-dependent dehydrogenase (short-subunit alcohol dehydrogenase family)